MSGQALNLAEAGPDRTAAQDSVSGGDYVNEPP